MTTTNTTNGCPSAILAWIPWYPDQLDAEQRGAVESHAAACRECRREIALLRGREVDSISAPDPERVYANVLARIESAEADDATAPRSGEDADSPAARRVEAVAARAPASWPLALAASLVAALLVGSAVGAWFLARPQEPIYHAASESLGAAAAGSVDVVFHEDVDITRVNEALRALGAQITGGPSEAGVYRVVPRADVDPAAAAKLLEDGPDGVAIFAHPSGQ